MLKTLKRKALWLVRWAYWTTDAFEEDPVFEMAVKSAYLGEIPEETYEGDEELDLPEGAIAFKDLN